jgi:hypothetical protein
MEFRRVSQLKDNDKADYNIDGPGNFVNNIKNELFKEKKVKRSEYIFAVSANLIILYIANNLLNWNLSFISASFSQVLWAINLTIGITILGNILFLIYNPPWFRHLMKAVMNFFAFIATYIFYIIFPLSFSQFYIVFAFKFALIVAMIILILSIAFELVKMFFRIF